MKLAYLPAHSLLITYQQEPCVLIPNHPPLEAGCALGSGTGPGERLQVYPAHPWPGGKGFREPLKTLLDGELRSDEPVTSSSGWVGTITEPAMAGGVWRWNSDARKRT